MSRVVAIVQARMGASRLPNKMMLHLRGFPVIEWVRRRCGMAKLVDTLVFALPDSIDNDVLDDYLTTQGSHVFRGSEYDVVGRFYEAALAYDASDIVRVCADNPLVTASEIDRLIDFFHSEHCDYAYNHIPRGNLYPDGLGAEITSLAVLEKVQKDAKVPAFREHVFNYIHAHPEAFSIRTFDPESDALHHPELRMDIDTTDDYRKLMNMDIRIDMSAEQAVEAVRRGGMHENS